MQVNIWIVGIACLIVGVVVGYMRSAAPPTINLKKQGAKVLVLGCIDPRFTERLAHFLINDKEVHDDYDLVALAGASLGVLQNDYPTWRPTFMDHVDLAVALHDIKEIWCFDHLDCGMYKATLGLADDHDVAPHAHHLTELQALLKSKYPQLGFRGYVLMEDGSVNRVVA